MRRSVVSRFATLLSSLLVVIQISAQPEVQAWSNITGIRVDGQLLRFESSLRFAFDDWQREWATARERQQSGYLRQGEAQVVQLEMDDFLATQTVRDTDPGQVRIQLTVHTRDTMTLTGAFYHLALPAADFAGAMVELIAPTALPLAGQPFLASGPNERLRAYAQGLRVHTARRELVITTPEPLLLVVREDAATGALGLYFTLRAGSLPKDWQRDFQFDISISGISEAEPAGITLFPAYPGNTFLGLGGNFRLQNMENDPQVIDYCLNNLEVRMGRVELPWDAWHPTDTINPLAA
ncbi:MAG: hypothetical protein KDC54_23985, partial [Lewinella sp.]|nr:hypothetical protein [Lewinella sp.]